MYKRYRIDYRNTNGLKTSCQFSLLEFASGSLWLGALSAPLLELSLLFLLFPPLQKNEKKNKLML